MCKGEKEKERERKRKKEREREKELMKIYRWNLLGNTHSKRRKLATGEEEPEVTRE